MANILLTSKCNQKCPYCFASYWLKSSSDELSFRNLKIILDFFEKSGEKNVRLMGGEPTLHSEFRKIIEYILSRGFLVQIFTNGIFPSEIRKVLCLKKNKVKYSFNINPTKSYNENQWKLLLNNLQSISQYGNCLVGSVIWQKDFNFDYLVDLTKKYLISSVAFRFANPIVGDRNQFVSFFDKSALGDKIIKEIKKFDLKKTGISFGCGLPSSIFNKSQKKFLKESNLDLKYGCQANSGRFDIDTDLSVFRCFPLSNWQKRKLLDFNNTQEIENYFDNLMRNYQLINSENNFVKEGPCLSYLLMKKNNAN